eukprot:COSAG04_NODE_2147_length_4696_cov_27.649772_3_plen_127_part_00
MARTAATKAPARGMAEIFGHMRQLRERMERKVPAPRPSSPHLIRPTPPRRPAPVAQADRLRVRPQELVSGPFVSLTDHTATEALAGSVDFLWYDQVRLPAPPLALWVFTNRPRRRARSTRRWRPRR